MIEVSKLSDFNDLLLNNKYVVVDFHAIWCGPCKKLSPHITSLSEQYKDIKFVKVNIDNASDISDKCNIESLPTISFYRNGVKEYEVIGNKLDDIHGNIKKLITLQ